ncbi:MAG: hypothetical protein AAF903_02025 [Pseudomonadota bacterium]
MDRFSNIYLFNSTMLVLLIVWVLLSILIVRQSFRNGTSGIVFALVLAMGLLYGGCFVYAVPGYTHLRVDGDLYLKSYNVSEQYILQATFLMILAMSAFYVGGMRRRSRRTINGAADGSVHDGGEPISLAKIDLTLVIMAPIGLVAFLLSYLNVSFPLSGALLEVGRAIGVATVCFAFFRQAVTGGSQLLLLPLLLPIPVYHMALKGFASYAFLFVASFASFWCIVAYYQKRLPGWFVSTLVIGGATWITLSLFLIWMSMRQRLREILWFGSDDSLFTTIMDAWREAPSFSLLNFEGLDLINIRLNLNLFVARLIEQHEIMPELRENGATLMELLFIWLPRFLWPDKPVRGGNLFASEHTGLTFVETVTIGTGPLFEFYVNFGYIGVVVGFFVFARLISYVDRQAFASLVKTDYLRFFKFFVVGILIIDPLLRPFFVVNGALFALILIGLIELVTKPFYQPLRSHLRHGT